MVNSLGLDGPAGGLRGGKKAKWDDWPPTNACLVAPENNAELSEDQKAILRALYNDAFLALLNLHSGRALHFLKWCGALFFWVVFVLLNGFAD
jgi:hypothetical protein